MPSNPPSAAASPDAAESALAPYLRAIRAHPLLIGAVALACVLASVLWLAIRSPQYETTAQVLVTPVGQGEAAFTGLPILTDSVDPTRTLQTAATVLQSPRAAVATSRELSGWSVPAVEAAVTVEPQGESNIVAVTAKAGDPRTAAELANTYTRSALSVREADLGRQIDTRVAGLKEREASLDPDSEAAGVLAAQINQLESIRNGQDPNFSLLQSAGEGSATGASSKMILALALIAGLTIGVIAAVAVEHLNRRVRDEDEALMAYPLPVLARVPSLPTDVRDAASPALMSPMVIEAFRTVQVQLDLTGDDGRTVMVTSASAGDGKTTSAVNLAVTLRRAGYRVALLDFDLRKPDIGSRLDVSCDLAALVRLGAPLADVLVEAPDVPGLYVLSCRQGIDVSPMLEPLSRRIPELVESASELADYVVIDTAPIGIVSDALRVAAAVDDIVLVTRPGNTNRADLQRTRELLEHMGQTPTGMLVLGAARGSTTTYGYGPQRPAPPSSSGPSSGRRPAELDALS